MEIPYFHKMDHRSRTKFLPGRRVCVTRRGFYFVDLRHISTLQDIVKDDELDFALQPHNHLDLTAYG
jgi:hypothetical protein